MTITQRTTPTRPPAGRVGEVDSSLRNRVIAAFQAIGQLAESRTATLSNWSADRTYTITVNGEVTTITTPAGDTDAAGAATRMAAALNANPAVRGQVQASVAGAVVTLTALWPGVAFTLSAGADVALALVQAAAEAEDLPIGRAVLRGPQGEVTSGSYTERMASPTLKRTLAANLTARVVHVTPTSANDTVYGLAIVLSDGRTFNFRVVSGGSATVQAIVEAQVAAFPAGLADIVTATEDDTKLILTATPGVQFEVVVTEGPQAVAVATAGSDAEVELLGITAIDDTMEMKTIGANTLVYPGTRPAAVIEEGGVLMECAEDVAYGDPVYIEFGPGDDNGKAYKTASATRLRWLRARWTRRATTSDDLAWLRLA